MRFEIGPWGEVEGVYLVAIQRGAPQVIEAVRIEELGHRDHLFVRLFPRRFAVDPLARFLFLLRDRLVLLLLLGIVERLAVFLEETLDLPVFDEENFIVADGGLLYLAIFVGVLFLIVTMEDVILAGDLELFLVRDDGFQQILRIGRGWLLRSGLQRRQQADRENGKASAGHVHYAITPNP